MLIYFRFIKEGQEIFLNYEKFEAENIDIYTAKMRKDDLQKRTKFTCRANFNEINYEMKKSVSYEGTKPNNSFDPEKVIKLLNVFLKSYNDFVKFYF